VLVVAGRDDALSPMMSSEIHVFGFPALAREPVGRAR
jgi:hypothetical protein